MAAMMNIRKLITVFSITGLLSACSIGPEFVAPESALNDGWSQNTDSYRLTRNEQQRWWKTFNDPELEKLLDIAWQQNNSLEIAGLRVLEAQAQLGIAIGNRYPQSQRISGDASRVSPAENTGGGANFSRYSLDAGVSWEIDFWGRFKRGIEAADATFMASVAARDQVFILLTAQIADVYTVLRVAEQQLQIAYENEAIQQRSYEIASVLYRNGSDSELDMQQAKTLLLSTQSTIPGFEIEVQQALNALSVLLGETPGTVDALISRNKGIPVIPEQVDIGFPAELLRRRPDVRQAEQLAIAQNARVGFAQTDLYPRFNLFGSIGLVSGGAGSSSNFGDLFSSDALTYSFGPSFVWPFLNYGRIINNVRVQDARLQQALLSYRETVLQAAREAEDAMVALSGNRKRVKLVGETVQSAKRSNELSTLRYKEGFSDYQRVLDSQQALFRQQQNLVNTQGATTRSLIALYKALGGGWQEQDSLPLITEASQQQMHERINWGEYLDANNLDLKQLPGR